MVICFVGSEGEGKKYFMVLKVTNSIGQDALMFSSDNQAPNGMLVKKGSFLTIVKTMVSKWPVNFIAMDRSTKARLFLNNLAKFKVEPSHSQEQVVEVTLTPSGKCLRFRQSRALPVVAHFVSTHTLATRFMQSNMNQTASSLP